MRERRGRRHHKRGHPDSKRRHSAGGFQGQDRQRGTETVLINPVLLWDPNDPKLYKVTFKLSSGGKVADQIHSFFGMRKIDYAQRGWKRPAVALRLNNTARYLRGALHQSYYPDGVYTAGSVETLKKRHSLGQAVRVQLSAHPHQN